MIPLSLVDSLQSPAKFSHCSTTPNLITSPSSLGGGATVSFIREDIVKSYNIPVQSNIQLALVADDKIRISSLGEVDITLTRGNILARLRALVMKSLQAPYFGGTTFHWDNDIQPQIHKRRIKIHDKHISRYNQMKCYHFSPYPRLMPNPSLPNQPIQPTQVTCS